MVATRMVCDRLSVETPSRAASSARGRIAQFGPVERGFRDHVGDDRNPLHLGRQFAGDVADDVAVDAGHDQRDRAQAVFVEEPEADIGNVFEFVADLEFELALGDLAIGLRRVVDDQRGARALRACPAAPGRRRRTRS